MADSKDETTSNVTDPRLLSLSPADNVLVACVALTASSVVTIDGQAVTLVEDIAMAHKIARRDLATGVAVIKYGAAIGSTTADVAAGHHVHLHNMKSDYIATVDEVTSAVYGRATE